MGFFQAMVAGAAMFASGLLAHDVVFVKQYTDTAQKIYNVSYNIEGFCSATAVEKRRKLLATAAHCLFKESNKKHVGYFDNVIYIVWHGGVAYQAIVYKIDVENDVALLQIISKVNDDFEVADTNLTPMVGEEVYCMGNSHGIFDSNLTKGIISSLNRKLPWALVKVIGSDCTIAPGNSGGGIFDAEGNLIGVVDATYGAGGTFSFHIPIWVVKKLMMVESNE